MAPYTEPNRELEAQRRERISGERAWQDAEGEIRLLRELLRQAHEILSTALDVIAAHVPEAPIRERIEAELDKIGGE
jgi:hypothetical protein